MEHGKAESPTEQESGSLAPTVESRSAARPTRRVLWLALVAAVVVVAGVIGWQTYIARNAEAARVERAGKAAAEADKELERVWAVFRARDAEWDAMNVGDDTDVLLVALGNNAQDLKTAQANVAEVRRLMKESGSAPVSKAYLEVCDELDSVIKHARDAERDATPEVAFFTKAVDARRAYIEGWSLVNDAVVDANGGRHSAAIKKCDRAKTEFTRSLSLFEEASRMDEYKDVAGGIAFAKGCITLAEMQRELSRIGQRGGVDSYNRQIRKLDAQKEKVLAMQSHAENTGSLLWSDVVSTNSNLVRRAERADEAWEKAKLLVASGEY